jgi:hypothetical protein
MILCFQGWWALARCVVALLACAAVRTSQAQTWPVSNTGCIRRPSGADSRESTASLSGKRRTAATVLDPDFELAQPSVGVRERLSAAAVVVTQIDTQRLAIDGLFVPKPSTGAACQRRSWPELGQIVRMCPLVSDAVGGDCHSLRHSVARGPPSGCKLLTRRRSGLPSQLALGPAGGGV